MRKFLIFLLFFGLVAGPVFGEWKSFDPNPRGPQKTQVNLLKVSGSETIFEINVPGYFTRRVNVDGKEYVYLAIPGSVGRMLRGEPLLPQLGYLLRVADESKPALEVIYTEEVEVDLPSPILPSKGHLTRDIDPDCIPYEFGRVYNENAWYPEQTVTMGESFRSWDMKGVNVQVVPVRYNPVTQKAKVIKSILLKLSYTEKDRKHTKRFRHMPRRFKRLYRNHFLNYKRMEDTDGSREAEPENQRGNLVAVFPNSGFRDNIGAYSTWKIWKSQCGYKIVEVFADSKTATDLKTAIWAESPVAIVLFGDASGDYETATPMPTFKGTSSGYPAWDRKYACNSDTYMNDALFSRVSGTELECSAQLTKIVNYEKGSSGEWAQNAIGIGSLQGSPADEERIGWLINGGGDYAQWFAEGQGLQNKLYPTFDTYFTNSSDAGYVADIKSKINTNGCGSMWYIGHGSSTYWVSTGFNCSDAKSLTNGLRMPFIFSVACVNGAFLTTSECFAEAWLRNPDGGAVAMEAGSTNEAWVPPCIKQAGSAASLLQGERCFGDMEKAGLLLAKTFYSGDSQYTQLAEQCNIFGDCTLLVKAKTSRASDLQVTRTLDSATFTIKVDGTLKKDARVTVYTEDFSFAFTLITEDTGTVSIPLTSAPHGVDLYYTVVGDDIDPVINVKLE